MNQPTCEETCRNYPMGQHAPHCPKQPNTGGADPVNPKKKTETVISPAAPGQVSACGGMA